MGMKRGPKAGLADELRGDSGSKGSSIGKAPSYLSNQAKTFWERITTDLLDSEILCAIDSVQLAILCNELAKYWECQKSIDIDGLTQSGEKTGEVKSAHVRIQETTLNNITKIANSFGLSPSARKQLAAAMSEAMESGPEEGAGPPVVLVQNDR